MSISSCRDFILRGFPGVSEYFILLACGTAFDIFCYLGVHVGPALYLFGFSDSFIVSWMASGGVIIHRSWLDGCLTVSEVLQHVGGISVMFRLLLPS
jgi:hypothetical protein